MALLMVSIGLFVGGLGVLGISGRLDVGALRWMGMTASEHSAVARQVGINRLLFGLVAASGVALAFGGWLEL